MNKFVSLVLLAVLTQCVTVAQSQRSALLAHYSFEEGEGLIVHDTSGNGIHGKIIGKARWVRGEFGTALELNGSDAFVDCGANELLTSVASEGTIEVWIKPYTVQGGFVNWSTGGGWNDERLVMAVDTYHGGNTLIGCIADGDSAQAFYGFGPSEENVWIHLALTLDGTMIHVYRDGLQTYSTRQNLTPIIHGVQLWLGRCLGLGKEYFHGLLDEVRIYNRSLSPEQIFASYKEEAPRRGKDTTLFHRVRLEAHPYPGPSKIVAELDVRAMLPLPHGSVLLTTLSRKGSQRPLKAIKCSHFSFAAPVDVHFAAEFLPPGDYQIRCSVLGPDGKQIGETSETTITWSGQPPELKGVKILNNLVWELLNVRSKTGLNKPLTFHNPCERWIFVRATTQIGKGGKVSLRVDREDVPIIAATAGSPSTQEAMLFMKGGKHTLDIKTEGKALVTQVIVRSIPMLQHAFYNAHPHIAPFGPYDWKFLEKEILPNINVMVGSPGPELEQWKKSGRKWIAITNLPRPQNGKPLTVQEAYEHWAASPGFQHPLMDGIIVDEFGGGDDPVYDIYRQAVERLNETPEFKGKMFIPYGGIFYGKDKSREFALRCLEGGGYIAWERYLREEPTEEAARVTLQRVADEMAQWESALPGVTRRMVMVYGIMSQPTESLNADPAVNFRVWMDMQMRMLATHPAFFGLGGIQEYHSSYSDEENLRWMGKLYRHYAIEGNTRPLTDEPYTNRHIINPDFAHGTEGWTIAAAEPDSVAVKSHKGYSWLEGRYPPTPMGNTFLWMKRSSAKPNMFSQQISNLKPGQVYSLKMITSDYQNLIQEKSVKEKNAISIELEGAEILPGAKNSFQFTFPNNYAHTVGKFNAQYPFWMNYHWRVFRAKGTTARLTVSDWQSPAEPGGPIGQELIYNFIEIQPYYAPE